MLPRVRPRELSPTEREARQVQAAARREAVERDFNQTFRVHGKPYPDPAVLAEEEAHKSAFRLPLSLEKKIPPGALPWYSILHELMENKDLSVFHYLTPTRDHRYDDSYSPFDLVLAPFDKCNKENYYTMAAAGITHHLEGEKSFYTLAEFEKEFFLFLTFRRFKMFRHYKTWCNFSIWKIRVAERKRFRAQEALSHKLLLLHPTFHEALVKVNTLCEEVAELRSDPFVVGRTQSMSAVLRSSKQLADKCRGEIVATMVQIEDICTHTCAKVQ